MGFCEDCHESFASIQRNIEFMSEQIKDQNTLFTKIYGTLSDISDSLKAKIELDKKIHNLEPSTD